MINQKHLKTTGNVLRRSYLPNDQSFWSLDLFVKDTYWWSLHDSTREEVKESTTKWTTQNKQGKLPQTQLPISHKSLLPHPGTLVGRQMPSWESDLCLLWQKSFLPGAYHPGQSRQILGLAISVPAKPQLVLALAFTAVMINATTPCVCQV